MKSKLVKIASVVLLLTLCTGCSKKSKSVNEVANGEWKPKQGINVIVGFAAGGGMDSLARAVAEYIDLDGQTMHVTNIQGSGGNIGGMEAYHSDNDGYTVYFGSPQANACNYLSGGLTANLNNEMVYISCLAEDVNVLTVSANSSISNFHDLVKKAKEKPGKITIASVGSGNSMNASAADVWTKANIDLTYVPYDSASKSRTAVLGGHEDLLWSQLAEVKSYVDSGELRILAIASEKRVNFYPETPTFTELGINAISGLSRSVMLPPKTDENIARYYDKKLKEVFENKDFRALVQDKLGYVLVYTDYDGMKNKARSVGEWADTMMPLVLNKK